jgi:hypothetical protein
VTEVRAVFDFDHREHFRAARALTRYSPARYFKWGMAAVGVGMIAWSAVPMWGRQSLGMIVLVTLPWILLTVFWFLFVDFGQWRKARKLRQLDSKVLGQQERAVDSFGFHSRGNGPAVDLSWAEIPRVVETADFFLFFRTKQSAYYLPRRAITNEQAEAVRALVRDALGDRASLRRVG